MEGFGAAFVTPTAGPCQNGMHLKRLRTHLTGYRPVRSAPPRSYAFSTIGWRAFFAQLAQVDRCYSLGAA
jgi:hypothetical protein